MGIINVTPDSFSGDGLLTKARDFHALALRSAHRMAAAGADIIDLGGQSTRPGARAVSAAEEERRVVPVIEGLAGRTPALISVDTSKPAVANSALRAGAHIVNVIQGTPVSDALLKLAKRYGAGIILMHMRGTPRTMQRMTQYADVVAEVLSELKKSVEKCLRFGLNEEAIVVDPGIGFAKTAEQNLLVIKELSQFARIHRPLLIGTSRKSFIGKVLQADVEKRLMGTAATVACSLAGGAHIVRVHDVGSMKDVAIMTDAIMNAKDKR